VAVATKHFRAACAAFLLSGVASAAGASPITINPNDFPFGTDLSTMYAGVTLSHLRNEPNHDGVDGREVFRPIASAVYAIPTYHAENVLSIGGFGMEVYGYERCRQMGPMGSLSSDCSNYDVLDLSFHTPTSFLEVSSIFFSDGPSILAYDVSGNPIAFAPGEFETTYTPVDANNSPIASTITLTRAQSDISRIAFGGVEGNSTPLEITYKVAEPATAGLLLLGVAGAAAFRRRR
jgi:hypothetical protein